MNVVNNAITCISCKQKLKAPVFLPCGHSICKHHEDEVDEENNKERNIECENCNETHEIPEKGFAPNRALESLMKVNIDELDLGDEYNSAFDKCNEFEDLTEEFNNIKNDPEMRINTVFRDLRNKVDLRREELKQEIDKKALEMIDKINEYEKDCKLSIKLDSSLDNKIGEWRNELEQSRLALNSLKKRTENWNEVSTKMRCHFKDLQSAFIKLNENLFLNRLDEFIYSDLKLTNDFYVISAEVKKLTEYKDVKESKEIVCNQVFAFGINWNLKVYIEPIQEEETNKSDTYIGAFLSVLQNPKIRNVKVLYDLAISDLLGNDKGEATSIDKVFDSNNGYGCKAFISLERLMEDFNLYNIEKDSCKIQAIIKKIEWL